MGKETGKVVQFPGIRHKLANKMSALVSRELSGFEWRPKEGADETDRTAAGGAENAFRGGIRGRQKRRLTQEEAAQMLGVCERTFRRQIDPYEESGLDGLIRKRLCQPFHHHFLTYLCRFL
jgi:Winged helix-turn helix